mgnify:CR=1 FL=1
MGKVSRDDVISILRRHNPRSPEHDFAIYADAFMSYLAAAANIADNGDICAHPRTGQPIENPYSAVRDKMGKLLRGISLETGDLWRCQARWYVAIADNDTDTPPPADFEPFLGVTAEDAAQAAAEHLDEFIDNYCHVMAERGGTIQQITINTP